MVELRDRPEPRPHRGRVVVDVRAAALNPKDVLTRAGKYRWVAGPRFPKRLGYDWAGVVTSIGPGVVDVAVGQPVLGMIGAWRAGACAERLSADVTELAPLPAGLDWTSAAALPLAGSTALQALRHLARVGAGQRVLINGASGGVGVFATQIAKLLGAHVTTLTSAANRELARSLGADEALDYRAWSPSGTYDVVFDVFGNRRVADLRPIIAPRGTLVSTVPKRDVLVAAARSLAGGPRVRLVVVRSRREDLRWLAEHAASGQLRVVIDRVLPLGELTEAQRHLQSKRARGKIVLLP